MKAYIVATSLRQPAPLASVIICTRNRAASLARTLQSVVEASAAIRDPWELLVVDNGSTDDTAEVIASFADRLPISRIHEPQAGLSNARNAGVRASAGKFVLWTDDDVIVDKAWLSTYFTAFRDDPDTVIFGGRTQPVYEEPKQGWFIANQDVLRSLLAIRDEPAWTTVSMDRVPYGLNYAIRGQEQRSHFYDPELGVAPNRRKGGEEVALIRQLLEEGANGRWIWGATVYHLIPQDRQSEAYIRRFYEALGHQLPMLGPLSSQSSKLSAILRTSKIWLKASLSYRIKRRSDRASSVPALVTASRARASVLRYLGRDLT